MNNRNKGVTLVALVVTIIVLLILAGVSLHFAFGSDSIIGRAEQASEAWTEGEEKETISLALVSLRMANKKVTTSNMQQQLDNSLGSGKTLVSTKPGDKLQITFNDSQHKYLIDGKGSIEELVEAELTEIYATLYDDGTLAFSHDSNTISGKTPKYDTWVLDEAQVLNGFNYHAEPWYSHVSEITKVDFVNKIVPGSMRNWLAECSNLTSIEHMKENLDTSRVTSMNTLFYNCSKLTNIDLSNFDTSNVTDMMNLFLNCSSLQSIDLSTFNTSNVTNMANMFANCNGLTTLDLSGFNTSLVTDMGASSQGVAI